MVGYGGLCDPVAAPAAVPRPALARNASRRRPHPGPAAVASIQTPTSCSRRRPVDVSVDGHMGELELVRVVPAMYLGAMVGGLQGT